MAIAFSGTAGVVSPRPAVVRLRDRWDILLDTPLSELRAPAAAAYAVEDLRSVGMSFFALVPDLHQPIRGAALGLARLAKHTHVLTPVDYGVVDWPPAKQRCLAVIYERPAGGPLAPVPDQPITPWLEQDIVERVLTGLLAGLRALSVEGMTHRGIRPTNIFFRDASRRLAVLGDCITAPPAAHQPAAYETIESASAQPMARGSGTGADDLYALGVLCLHLAHGMPAGHGFTDLALLDEKIRRGSFNALVGDARLSPAMLELLRGLLLDDPEERWTLKDVEAWLEGRRLTPKVMSPAHRSARPFDIAGETCFTARDAARALIRHGDSAVHAARSHGLQVWLERSLGNKTLIDGVGRALADGEDPNGGGSALREIRLVARVAIALDPAAPIRYRAQAIAIDGLGSALAAAMLSGGDVQPLAEILRARLPQFWCQRQSTARSEFLAQMQDFDRLRRILEDHRPGFGIERLAYETSPALPCLSPFVAAHYVIQLADLLPALELAAAEGKIQIQPIDRHVAAFLAHHTKQIDEASLFAVGGTDPTGRLVGALYLLAQLQHDRGPAALPALTQLFGRQAKLLIDRFRHRPTRTRLESELSGILAEASLPKLLNFLDNGDDRRRDAHLFAKACHNFTLTRRAIERCERERSLLPEEATQTSSAIAAGLSMLIGVVVLMISVLVFGPF
ncbi:MAG: hypothetical protein WCC64_17585 [Aliidongia sp.]